MLPTNLSRRTILAGAVAVPALALPAAAILSVASNANADPAAADAELTEALSNVRALDLAIEELQEKFGDDADQRIDYGELESRQYDALDVLATVPARSKEGMTAKAAALNERTVIGDCRNCPGEC